MAKKSQRTRVEKVVAIRPQSDDSIDDEEESRNRFRSLDDLREEQVETNARRQRRSLRSITPESLDWDDEDEEAKSKRRIESKWTPTRTRLIVAAAAIAVGFGFLLAFSTAIRSAFEKPLPKPAILLPKSEPEQLLDFESMVTAAIATVEEYFSAVSVEESLAFLHETERVRPLVEGYYRSRAFGSDRPLRVGVGEAYLIEWFAKGKRFLVTNVEMRNRSFREIVLVESKSGDWKIDWEGYVGYSETNWRSFAEEHPSGAKRFRVIVSADDYFNYEFDDADRYSSFKLTDRNESTVLYGYVERGSTLESEMQLALENKEIGLMILDLRFPEGSKGKNQVEITEVVATTWLPGIGKDFHGITERMPLPQ